MKAYNIQNTAKVRNQELLHMSDMWIMNNNIGMMSSVEPTGYNQVDFCPFSSESLSKS